MSKGYFIGELARLVGTNPNTIRYYEAQGLLSPAQRSESGYRIYGEGDAARLLFIQKAKLLGMSLTEIKEIVEHQDDDASPCARVSGFLDQKIDEVDQRIKDLNAFRGELISLRQRMVPDGGLPEGRFCGFIEELDLQNVKGDRDGKED
jgi:DNA-binding transcriptional MerR regulator